MNDSAGWRDALLFQAETACTSLPRSSRVTHRRKTMKHKGRKYNLQTECRFAIIGTVHPHTIAGAGNRGIQQGLSNFSITIVATKSQYWVCLTTVKSNSRCDYDLDRTFQHCSGSLQICQAQAVQWIHGNECQGWIWMPLNCQQGKKKNLLCTLNTHALPELHMWSQIEILFYLFHT